jgi:hypothetical protein
MRSSARRRFPALLSRVVFATLGTVAAEAATWQSSSTGAAEGAGALFDVFLSFTTSLFY